MINKPMINDLITSLQHHLPLTSNNTETKFIKNVKFYFCSFMSLKKGVNVCYNSKFRDMHIGKMVLTKKYAFDFDHIENTHLVL